MKRPLGWICLLFVLFIRLFYVCFPPSLPDYTGISGREVYINGQIISIKMQEVYGELQTVYTLTDVTMKESGAVSDHFYLSDKSNSAGNTKEEKLNKGKDSLYTHKKIFCYAGQGFSEVHIGSWVWIKGTFEPFQAADNPGQFDSRFYYHMQGVGASVQTSELVWTDKKCDLYQEKLQLFKAFLIGKLSANYSEKYGGVMKTVMLGDRTDLDKELKKTFQEGGVLHILTISGLHISMLGMGCFRLVRKIGGSQKVSAVIGLFVVIVYGVMIGTQAATFRAICMFVMQMAAVLAGRTYDRLTGLSVAAVLLLLEQPLYVFYSGFLLSFGAVLGVTVLSPVLENLCKNRSAVCRWFCKMFAGGVGIFLLTFPIQLYFYYEYPIYSMLVNILVVPFLPYVVFFGLAVLMTPQGLTMLISLLVWGSEGMLKGYEWVCLKSREFPFHTLVLGAPKEWQMVCYYVCLAVWIAWLKYVADGGQRGQKRNRAVLINFGFLAAIVMLLWRPVEGLTCRFLSVGQGDCAIIQYGEETYVIDGGSTSNKHVGTQILLPCLKYYGVSEVDGVFISHADGDHMNGIVQWLEEYEHSHVRIGSIVLPSLSEQALKHEFGELLELAAIQKIPVATLGAGEQLVLGDLKIEALHPPQEYNETEDTNGYSQVLLFQYEGKQLLMTGDIGEEQEAKLCEGIEKEISILKAPHHGSKYSSSAEFLEACKPRHVILSYGVGNSYGHPHKAAVERMQEVGSTLWYTGRSGMIECVMTERKVRIRGFR